MGPLDILHRLYPQARVTSAYRDPNSKLGRANPRSYHNIGQAFDIAPMQGVKFGDYVNSLKSNGVNVVEALDEATHPLPHTTGPNWHIAYGAQQVAPRKPRTLADMATSPIPESFVPMSMNEAQPMQSAPMTLADLNLPQGQIPKPNHTRQTLGNIAGVLGDALMAYGGMQPQFGPNLMRQQDEERQMGFEREKLNAQLEAARQKALEPPQYIQNAQAWAGLTPEQKRLVLQQQDAVNPINVSTPQGTQNVPRTTTKTINGKTYYQIGGEWYEESE
jgi:hypothetical protein